MRIRMKRAEEVRGEALPFPHYATPGSAGLDLYADKATELMPGDVAVVPTGLCFEIPEGYEGQVRPRSGISSKTDLLVVVGTIDSDFRGEVGIIVRNVGRRPTLINRGMRLAQIVFAPIVQPTLIEVESLSETERGTSGFGSSGT